MYRHTAPSIFKSAEILYKSNICKRKIINNKHILNKALISCLKQNYSNKAPTKRENLDDENDKRNLVSNLDSKYKVFRDEDAPIIFDINEEAERIQLDELNVEEEHIDPIFEIKINHGINGVFEIEDFVDFLRRDKNIKQIFVASVPKEYNYVDYIVIITGISPKHMNAVAINTRKVYKAVKYKNDIIPKIEGENSKDWIAIDLGNIAFHIFSQKARRKFDLETLWAVGSEYDDLSNQKAKVNVLDKYKEFLKILQPAE